MLSYLPTILIHLLFRPLWYKGVDSCASATTTEMIITMLILPLYLVMTNYSLAKTFNKLTYVFVINALIIISCIWLSSYMHFKNWADSIGNWNSPDSETLEVMGFEKMVGIILCLLGLAIILVHLIVKNKKLTSQQQ